MVETPSTGNDPTVVNEAVWAVVANEFAVEGWSDEGELGALLAVADDVRGQPILDLGVGAGRTVALLRLLSTDYVAVDRTPAMVELCRSRHPGVDIRHGDARSLVEIASGSIALVNFSLNGIDSVDHDDRQRVLDEMARVLRPGGFAVLSTLNLNGTLYGCDPGNAPSMAWLPGSLIPLEQGLPMPPDEGRMGRAVRNWRRLRKVAVTGDGWAIAPMPAHEFGILTHFTTLPRARSELAEHGLEVVHVFPAEARLPLADGEPTTSPYVHLVARRS